MEYQTFWTRWIHYLGVWYWNGYCTTLTFIIGSGFPLLFNFSFPAFVWQWKYIFKQKLVHPFNFLKVSKIKEMRSHCINPFSWNHYHMHYPPASEASREVTNLIEEKIHTHSYVLSKNCVCLSVCSKNRPQLSQYWWNRWPEIFLGISCQKSIFNSSYTKTNLNSFQERFASLASGLFLSACFYPF